MARLIAISTLLCLSQALGQSVKSCGGAGDILSNAVFSVSPDPVKKGSALTITGSGTLTAAFVGGNAILDLKVKALGIINEPISTTEPFTFLPGIAAGDTKVVIGPFTLPKVPGSVAVSGTVKLTDASGAAVACIALNLSLLDSSETLAILSDVAVPTIGVPTNCGTAADHLKDLNITTDGGVTSVTGTLDEDIGSGSLDVNLKVKVSFISIPLAVNVPFTFSPAIPKGPFKLSGGSPAQQHESAIKVSVKGDLKLDDSNSEEVFCLHIDS